MEYLVEFNPRDSELFELVSEAALDLCNYRLNKGENDESVKNLFQLQINRLYKKQFQNTKSIFHILYLLVQLNRGKTLKI